MKRNHVAAIWMLGLVVALLAFELGSNHFLATLAAISNQAFALIEQWTYDLSRSAAEFVRAAAIGLYVVFVALSLLVLRQGGRARTALVVVSLVFYFLVGGTDFDASNSRWFSAFILAGIAALIMTARLTGPTRGMAPRS